MNESDLIGALKIVESMKTLSETLEAIQEQETSDVEFIQQDTLNVNDYE